MAYLFIGAFIFILIVWVFKASTKKNISGTSYTPYDDIISGKVHSHPPIERMNDTKHSAKYEDYVE